MSASPFHSRALLEEIAGPFEDFAVLCGAGISAGAGLPVAVPFVKGLLKEAAPDEQTATELYGLLVQKTDAPWLRFEGLLQVLKLYADPKLEVLNAYSRGNVQPIHRRLAAIAEHGPVMTTNFDGLIEEAAIEACLPVTGHYSDADHASVGPGIFKLHGTLWKTISGRLIHVQPNDADGPVGTLERVAMIRHSVTRRKFFTEVFSRFPVVIVGYSGSDDFDISYWLGELVDIRGIVWFQFDPSAVEPAVLSALQCKDDPRVDPGARRVAAALSRQGLASKFRLAVTNRPDHLLADLSPTVCAAIEPGTGLTVSECEFKCDPFQQHLLAGALFSHVFRLREASDQLQAALSQASEAVSRVKAAVALAEALFNIGAEEPRRRCKELAKDAGNEARSHGLLEWHLRAGLLANLESALVGETNGVNGLQAVFEEARNKQFMDVAALAETWLVRANRLQSGEASSAANDTVLLEAEFAQQHETARREWNGASDPSALQLVAEKLLRIAETRLALGAAPGACDSFIQQGVVLMRVADWPRHEILRPDSQTMAPSRSALNRALELARTCGLRRQAYSAAVSLALLHARFEPGRPDSRNHDHLGTEYADVLAVDAAETLRVVIADLLLHLGSTNVASISEFVASFDDAARHEGAGKLAARLRTTARINARVLEAWGQQNTFEKDTAGDLSPLIGDQRAQSPYWCERLKVLERAAPPRTNAELQDRLWLLLDTQPPNPLGSAIRASTTGSLFIG